VQDEVKKDGFWRDSEASGALPKHRLPHLT
jgi:hypothetical protein